MKEIDINLGNAIVAQNSQLLSKLGSMNGKSFFKVNVEAAWRGKKEGFEKDKAAIESGENKGFILNRSPRRLLIKNHAIFGVVLTTDPISNESGVAVNPHDDGTCDLFLPISEESMKIFDRTTAEAVAEAVAGRKDHFFLDGSALVKLVNNAIETEVKHLEAHITACQKMLTTLKGDISENEQKAKKVADQWINSALPDNINIPGGRVIMTKVEEG